MQRTNWIRNLRTPLAMALLLAAPSAPQARPREHRAHVRTARVDDECDVRLPRRFQAVAYDRRRHKRLGQTTLPLVAGVQVRLVSTMQRTLNGKRSVYYIYRWSHRGKQRDFVLDRRVPLPTRYDGRWRPFALLPRPDKHRHGDPPNLVTRLRVVR